MPGPNLHFGNKRRKDKVSPEEAKQRQELLSEKDSWIVDYNFDTKGELWCEVSASLLFTYVFVVITFSPSEAKRVRERCKQES